MSVKVFPIPTSGRSLSLLCCVCFNVYARVSGNGSDRAVSDLAERSFQLGGRGRQVGVGLLSRSAANPLQAGQ